MVQRNPEIALCRAAGKTPILHIKRVVEPELLPQFFDLSHAGVLRRHEHHGVAREVDKEEADDRNSHGHINRLPESL
jgi:hypothetical protein